MRIDANTQGTILSREATEEIAAGLAINKKLQVLEVDVRRELLILFQLIGRIDV